MIWEEHTKEVYFNQWCPKCSHYNKSETKDPCNECLTQGWNIDSHKPINFKEGDTK